MSDSGSDALSDGGSESGASGGGTSESGWSEIEEVASAHYLAMWAADVLRADVAQMDVLLGGLPVEPCDSPCYPTLHPFCTAYHQWACNRLCGGCNVFSTTWPRTCTPP